MTHTHIIYIQANEESGSRKFARKRVGPGERRISGACTHCFQYLILAYQLWYTHWLVSCDSLLQHLRQSFAGFARAESNKHVEHV